MPSPLSRRSFFAAAAAAAAATSAKALSGRLTQRIVDERAFTSSKSYANPFTDVDLDVLFEGPGGTSWRVPAFWSGDQTWRVRFAPPVAGPYRWMTECTDAGNASLHGLSGEFEASEYAGDNPLLARGPVGLAAEGAFEYADGSPFFFLADDWWHGLTDRLRWPAEFRDLTLDRKQKGYSVIKMTAGLNCDVAHFDPRNHNEAGHCYLPGYERINPAYFDHADLKVQFLVEQGLVPCIVGAWGYYLADMGVERMKRHWRYVLARWGAYPVVWQLTMESDMTFYGDRPTDQQEKTLQREGWSEVGRYLADLDPWSRLITLQPSGTTGIGRNGVTDPSFLSFDSMQVGHGDLATSKRLVRLLGESASLKPQMPFLPGEICFEGIGWQNWQNVQRRNFWTAMLNGASGFCYGANGIWQFNRRGKPFGPSPHGRTWGGDPWDVAAHYEGCRQVGLSKMFLETLPWQGMKPQRQWIRIGERELDPLTPPFAAGIPGKLRIFYVENQWTRDIYVRELEKDVAYQASWFDPVEGVKIPIGPLQADGRGEWNAPQLPGIYDFVLVLEAA